MCPRYSSPMDRITEVLHPFGHGPVEEVKADPLFGFIKVN